MPFALGLCGPSAVGVMMCGEVAAIVDWEARAIAIASDDAKVRGAWPAMIRAGGWQMHIWGGVVRMQI